jgi:tRNA G18 (ribose-2'-O)-methylase SpoU
VNTYSVQDPADPRLDDYLRLTDMVLRRVKEPADGLYIAESLTVLARALDALHRPRSVLTADKWLPPLEALLASKNLTDVEILVASDELIETVTGFSVHRGTLASMHRPVPADPMDIISNRSRLVIMEDIVDHTNVGALFRSVAGVGADAVWVTQRCADPLYRRSIRVSMGTVFQVPWATITSVADMVPLLHNAGWTVAALALDEGAIDIDVFAAQRPSQLAILLGTEGEGLSSESLECSDHVVTIPMKNGVDSLNVAAAGALALWALR